MAKAHVGLSGYSYKPWQGPGRFYPPTLKQNEFLRYYATRYDTVELDGVWYRLPSERPSPSGSIRLLLTSSSRLKYTGKLRIARASSQTVTSSCMFS